MTEYKYILIRSARKTISLEITSELKIIVRAPNRMKDNDIELFVSKHYGWIEKHLEKRKNLIETKKDFTPEKIIELKQLAKELLPIKTAHYAKLMGVHPTSVKITSAKKRFGSCSSKNGICYSWHLMEYPDAAIDYVVVHELAHIKHKNHGKAFYAFIQEFLPGYKERIKILKKI